MSALTKENKEIAIKFFEALSSGSATYLDFYNDDSIIWTAGDNDIGGTRTKKEIVAFAEGILAAFPTGIKFNITGITAVSYTHLTLPTTYACRSRWSPYH